MAVQYNTKIVTDGLVLCLDAANRKSYPGSGTTWTDLSGRGNNGTLINGVTYLSSNGGTLAYDGTNAYINCGNSSIFNQSGGKSFTITCWALFNSVPAAYNAIFNKAGTNGSWEYALGLSPSSTPEFYSSSNGTSWTGLNLGETIVMGRWYYYVVGYNFSSQLMFGTLNNRQIITTSQTGIFNGSRPFEIGRHNDPVTYTNGRISNLNFYNRALTAAEIQQNFNTLRGRYGI
jgi:hypothetical protein